MITRASPQPSSLTAAVAVAALLFAGCAAPVATPVPSLSPTASTTAPAAPSPTLSPAMTTTPSPSPTAAPTPSARAVIHTVVRGDTLSLVARGYDTTWQSLVFWNKDRYAGLNPVSPAYDPGLLEVGWELIVWPGVVVPFDAPLPTRTPRPTTEPQPTSPPTQAASVLVSHGSRSSRMVALTFDGGGRVGDSVAIVRWLRDHNVPATIFITGASAATSTGRDVISIINGRPDLFDLGNHSYGHPDMSTLTVAQVVDELQRAEAAILATAKQSPRPIFRPPYGAWDNDVLIGAGRAGYGWSVMWDVDPIDWKAVGDGGPTSTRIANHILSKAQNGSIILNHLGGWNTLEALPSVVAGLRDRGYTLVTLNRLLGL